MKLDYQFFGYFVNWNWQKNVYLLSMVALGALCVLPFKAFAINFDLILWEMLFSAMQLINSAR